MDRVLAGAIAGLVSTAAMTAAMEAMFRALPDRERYPLPPREITEDVTERTGTATALDERQHRELALASHFAYGAAAGAVYAPLARAASLPPALGGIGYGLAVWAVSYLGWIPALRILRPATEHPARRNALMLAAHAVWGLTTGLAADRLTRPTGGRGTPVGRVRGEPKPLRAHSRRETTAGRASGPASLLPGSARPAPLKRRDRSMTHTAATHQPTSLDPAVVRDNLTAWLRDAHAMESQAIEIHERQLDRLQNYPELQARLQQHLEETRRQRDTVAQCLQRLGTDTSAFKDTVTWLTGNVQAILHSFSGDEVLKGLLANYSFEAFEIVSYKSNIAAAESIGETGIASSLRGILAEEQAMLGWLDEHIAPLTHQYLARAAAQSGTAKR